MHESEAAVETLGAAVVPIDAEAHRWVSCQQFFEQFSANTATSPFGHDGHAEFGDVVGDEAVAGIVDGHPATERGSDPRAYVIDRDLSVVAKSMAEVGQVVRDVRLVEDAPRRWRLIASHMDGLVEHLPQERDVVRLPRTAREHRPIVLCETLGRPNVGTKTAVATAFVSTSGPRAGQRAASTCERNTPGRIGSGRYGGVVFTRPEDLADSRVVDALLSGWGMCVDEIAYAPVGFGSHHWRVSAGLERWFVTADDLDAKRRDRAETFDEAHRRLSAALSTARLLRDGGMRFVIAPVRTVSGRVVHIVDGRFAIALYPDVDGESYPWEPYPTRADRVAVVDLIAAIHRAPPSTRAAALTDDFAIPCRAELVAALVDRLDPWRGGPFAEPARCLLDRHGDAVQRMLERYDGLATVVASEPERMVLTHGEPHRGNTIGTANGVVLVDWDTALIAPPERDLWSLVDEDPSMIDYYLATTGVTLDGSALELYRRWWDLTEISMFIGDFRRAHRETEDTRVAWAGLTRYLDPTRWRA